MDKKQMKNSKGTNVEKINPKEIQESKDDELVDIVMQKILKIK